MQKGDLVRDLRTGDMGYVTDTYVQPQINKIFVKIYAAGRETGWINANEVELVLDPRDVVEYENQSRRKDAR
jgi:hypothetical protein